jgi:hypothetical protein
MSTINDGGPAFPSVGEGFGNPSYSAPGMTLRDWFASQALAGVDVTTTPAPPHLIAGWCYGMADEMLKAREVQPPRIEGYNTNRDQPTFTIKEVKP